MGMFDNLIIHKSIPLPVKNVYGLQTKNLGCELTTYKITKFGRLVREDNGADQNYHGGLSAVGSSDQKLRARSDLIMLDMYFRDGFLQWTQGKEYVETEVKYSEKVNCRIPLWMKLWRIAYIIRWELKMIFCPPERYKTYIIPEKSETIPF